MSPLLQSQLVPLLEHQRELAIVNAIIRMTRPAPFQLLKFCWRPVVYLAEGLATAGCLTTEDKVLVS